MEANKVQGEAKSLILDNGIELTYCERGEQNKEVLLTCAFYFHTFMPVVERLAERYHVIGMVMRFDGKTTELNADGTTHWGKQWGSDAYELVKALGIEKFHYVGKCHGTVPGWYFFKNHPEMLIDFCSFFLAPHLKGTDGRTWLNPLNGDDSSKMMAAAMRNVETGLPKKMAEMAALGGNVSNPAVEEYAAASERLWDSLEECEDALKNTTVPVGYLFGSEDPLLEDYYTSNMYAWRVTKGCHFTILQGEKHLMELDCPDRVADEAFAFIDQAHKNYE